MSTKPATLLLPLLACVAATACFQIGAALAKGLFPHVGAPGAAALRLVLGSAMLLLWARPWRNWPEKPQLGLLLALGAGVGGAILFFYLAIARLPLGMAIALQFLGPLGVAVLGSRRPVDLVWAVLAAGGVWSLVGAGEGIGALDPWGLAAALAAAACWAGYILVGRAAANAFGRSTSALSASVATILVLPVGVTHAGTALLDPALLPLAAVVALVAVAIPFSLELYALPRLPARTFAVLTSTEPAFGALFGFLVLHERLAMSQLGGVAAVIVAAAGAAWSSTRELPKEIPPA
ncbi:DMT family transporter [Phenylobacterium sp. J367]|uniref:EamA family transporter n=1 Tax=Phenylobacterium sp. J367 TaxID=2898435 RepID=UPI002150C5D0|nr:EamA family transporter [Phenylobacterium sp. J367]MCR5878087.1 EamA family transporter [Phenylobacterium sp. J367]